MPPQTANSLVESGWRERDRQLDSTPQPQGSQRRSPTTKRND